MGPNRLPLDAVFAESLLAATHVVRIDISAPTPAAQAERGRMSSHRPWDLLYSWTDFQGTRVAMRWGTGSWGYVKITKKHNVDASTAKASTRFADPSGFSVQRTARVYFAPVLHIKCRLKLLCRFAGKTDVKTVNETRNDQGVITTFCPGYQPRCPDWVRKAGHRIH